MNWAVVAVCLFSGIAFSEKEKKKKEVLGSVIHQYVRLRQTKYI